EADTARGAAGEAAGAATGGVFCADNGATEAAESPRASAATRRWTAMTPPAAVDHATYTAGGVALSRAGLGFLLVHDRHGQDVRLLAPRPLRRRVHRRQAEPLAQPAVDLGADVRVVLQELPRVLAALADALAVERVPGPRLLDHLVVHPEVEQVAFLADPLAVEDVEL